MRFSLCTRTPPQVRPRRSVHYCHIKIYNAFKIVENSRGSEIYDLLFTVYGSSSLHHLHQYLGANEGFKTPPSRYHSHYPHQYGSNHHHHHHHAPPSYTETFLNYSRLSSHESALDSKTQELPPPPSLSAARDSGYTQETDSTGRDRDAATIPYENVVQRSQLSATSATSASAQSILDGTASSKIEQAPYACLGVGSCVC